MRTPRYYVIPTDCGSDILCMLMPHNVGFVPLFSIYLFDSPSHGRFCGSRASTRRDVRARYHAQSPDQSRHLIRDRGI